MHSVLRADKDELTGDDPRQFANLENAKGGVVVNHGGVCGTTQVSVCETAAASTVRRDRLQTIIMGVRSRNSLVLRMCATGQTTNTRAMLELYLLLGGCESRGLCFVDGGRSQWVGETRGSHGGPPQ